MRKHKRSVQQKDFSILTLDDDLLMTETLQSYLKAAGYDADIENNPLNAVKRIQEKKYDILLLDFLMDPICGDEVVRRIREFDHEIFIILLTGHKSMAPPVKTIRELDIQGYYEKSERFDQLELLIESCVKSIAQMRTIRHYRDGLRTILSQVQMLNRQESMDAILQTILLQLGSLLSCHDIFVYFNFGSVNTDITAESSFGGRGVYENEKALAEKYFHDTAYIGSTIQKNEEIILAPLCADDRRRYGLLAIRKSEDLDSDDEQLFEVYAKQAGSLVSNIYLRFILQEKNEKLLMANEALRKNYLETVDAVRKMVDAKDYYTRGHSDRVSFYAVRIAREMGKSEEDVEKMRVAGLFHDIGKVRIPDMILRKEGKLTEEEYSEIKKHPVYGRELLSSVSSFRNILDIIEFHHEWYNGKGYPEGRSGEDIPEEARIISVADAFDAMTSKRTYRDSFSLDYARGEIQNGRGTQFDPQIADVFLKILEDPDRLEKELAGACSDTIEFKK